MSQQQLGNASVTACRNTDCRTASLSSLQGASASPHAVLLPVDSTDQADRDVRLSIFATVGEQRIAFRLSWTLPSAGAVTRSDVLAALISSSADEQLFAAQSPVEDVTSMSNECGGGACRRADVALVAP